MFFDALRVKIRDEGVVRSKAVYLALAMLPDGTRDILGIWIEQTEGAKFWLKVFTDLKTRGCADLLIAVTDGLKGMPEALAAAYPATTLQTCLVHLIRNSLEFAGWQERRRWRRRCGRSIRPPRPTPRSAALDEFAAGPWGRRFRRSSRCGARRGRASSRSSRFRPSSADDLHDQRARERPRARAQDHQDPRPLPDR